MAPPNSSYSVDAAPSDESGDNEPLIRDVTDAAIPVGRRDSGLAAGRLLLRLPVHADPGGLPVGTLRGQPLPGFGGAGHGRPHAPHAAGGPTRTPLALRPASAGGPGRGRDVPGDDVHVGPLGAAFGALAADLAVGERRKLRCLPGHAAHRIHLPSAGLARRLLSLWGRRLPVGRPLVSPGVGRPPHPSANQQRGERIHHRHRGATGRRARLVGARAEHDDVGAAVGHRGDADVLQLVLLHAAHLDAHLHEQHAALRPQGERLPFGAALPGGVAVRHADGLRGRPPHREESVQRHRRTQTLHAHRHAVSCRFPAGGGVRRLQPGAHRHLPHAHVGHRGHRQLRRLHEPDRHRPPVRRVSPGRHQHVRDHSRDRRPHRDRIFHRGPHHGGLEESLLGFGRRQRGRRRLLHAVRKRRGPAVGRAARGRRRGRGEDDRVRLTQEVRRLFRSI
ncbi:uncharacterized protein si:ch1073-513e17.1 isoform X2 [Phyllopteryx taeniolatus]|uniref:uncharacterized protein si:ch1073-513e17.1 isoform X2 n=1 Tax=Phyllopteryx taeniolatus TaxID=161469 RepID=UPI002AD29655|nr:uncharacterized protein si:ch1073-513e17.1 isoform X2 [Phyllopteryx taeniolatus]